MCACNCNNDDFIKNLITFSAVREMLLSNTTLFHPVHAAGTYSYTTLVIFQVKHTFMLKKNVKMYLEKNMCKPGFFCVMVATRLVTYRKTRVCRNNTTELGRVI